MLTYILLLLITVPPAICSAMLKRRFNDYENHKLLELIDILDKGSVALKSKHLKYNFFRQHNIEPSTKNLNSYFVRDFIVSLFPAIAIINIIHDYNFNKKCYVFEHDYYNPMIKEIKRKKINLIRKSLPNSCLDILMVVDEHMDTLKRKKHYKTLAEDSYSLLMNVIESSFINGELSNESVKSIRKSLFELDMFFSNLVNKSIKIDKEEAKLSQSSINQYHEKFQGFIKSMSSDLKNEKAIF